MGLNTHTAVQPAQVKDRGYKERRRMWIGVKSARRTELEIADGDDE